ncbi:hypothetical protein KC354_g3605 [Hortaea werneckii]|nr:hypothetical protein KC354_g3605 [Hortaea werneckii]KAI7481789.1 hypothetical protein KC351_g6147 [Hortaea werneckii]
MSATLLSTHVLNMAPAKSGYDTMASWDRFTTFEFNEQVQRRCAAAPLYTSATPSFHTDVYRKPLVQDSKPVPLMSRTHKQPSPIKPPAPTFKTATSSWSPPSSPGARSRSSTLTPPRTPRVDSARPSDSPICTPMTPREKNKLADSLYAAACAGDLDHIKLLLSLGAPINAGTMVEGLYEAFKPAKPGLLSPLAGAARNGQMDAVELLIAAGAEPNPSVNRSSSSPLHQAIRADDLELSRLLLELGANINSLNDYKTTPLMYAVKYGSAKMVELILEHHPDMARLSFIGAAAIHWAVWPNRPEIMELLVAAGADCDHGMADGSTPLHCASTAGHLETVECLLRLGADPTLRNDDWKTASQVAVENGHEQIAALLREATLRRRTV